MQRETRAFHTAYECRKLPDPQLICFHLIKILCYRRRQHKWKLLFTQLDGVTKSAGKKFAGETGGKTAFWTTKFCWTIFYYVPKNFPCHFLFWIFWSTDVLCDHEIIVIIWIVSLSISPKAVIPPSPQRHNSISTFLLTSNILSTFAFILSSSIFSSTGCPIKL